ncbi:MAG TPA: Rrf2 family transcriptional regulator [Meiothermus sp.]|jgi:Rrf2 family protein|nr:Rrf2 family transcriptional regulator [Meiothermus sp.]
MAELRTLIKREESYGIHALVAVAENPGIGAAEVAQKLQVPPAFLAKVMRKLAKAGLIESRMGRGGGVWLKADLQKVSLLSVIEALSGPVVMDTCQTKPKCATEQRKGHCNLKPVWILSSLEIRELLDRFKLSQLIEKAG